MAGIPSLNIRYLSPIPTGQVPTWGAPSQSKKKKQSIQ